MLSNLQSCVKIHSRNYQSLNTIIQKKPGMIERMFCEISSWLGRDIIARGWITAGNMIHYNVHEKVDIRHSQDFFDILEPVWNNNDPQERYSIEQGLRLSATVFNDLYVGLYRSRTKRLNRAPNHNTHRHVP